MSFIEFGTRCADGDTSGTFIELVGGPNESTRILTGLRAFDHTGAVLFDMSDVYGANGWSYYSWLDGSRRFLLMTRSGEDRLMRAFPGYPYIADNIIPSALDPAGGRLVLYRVSNGVEAILNQVSYGTGAVPAPPSGTSMEFTGTGWHFQPSPHYDFFFDGTRAGLIDGCLGYQHFFTSELTLACEDGEPRGQYVELRATGPNTTWDSRLHVRLYDHTGALLADLADPFGAHRDQAVAAGTSWLLGGPGFTSQGPDSADGTLPVELDRIGGRIEMGGSFYNLNWISDSFSYGTVTVPAPADGYALSRPAGAKVTVQLPAPVNSHGASVLVPDCGAGTGVPHLVVNELALQCMDGRTQGQFVELSVRGVPLALDAQYVLRAYRRDGAQAFEMPNVFRNARTSQLARSQTFLLVQPGHPSAPLADDVLPDTLDPVAGRVDVFHQQPDGDSLVATLAWGDPPLSRPPAGSSLDGSGTTPELVAYPTPTAYNGTLLPPDACLARVLPLTLEVDEMGLECTDGSRAAAFVELGGLVSAMVHDPSLGLRLVTGNGDEMARAFPLFPPRDAWPLTGSQSWLVGAPGFAAMTGLAPDATWSTTPAGTPAAVFLFRRNPLTGVDTPVSTYTVRTDLLAPGHTAVRMPDGQYERGALATPRRFDGASVPIGGCWAVPHPEAAALHAVMLGCRDGDPAGQYVVLSATSPEAQYSPDLVLRVRDRAGHLLGETRAPYPPAYANLGWPIERPLLVGAPGFAARTGASPDALLPAVLDTLAGRIELLLVGGGVELPLDAVDYGTAGLPAPPGGACLERGDTGWTMNPLPAPSGITARLTPPTACLGKCPGRTARFALGSEQAVAGLDSTMSGTGSEFEYDTAAGGFRLDSSFNVLAVRWSDHYQVEGVPPGTPLALIARVRTILSSKDSCAAGRCGSSLASVVLASSTGSDSAAAKPDPRRVLELPVTLAGGGFDLELRLRANGVEVPSLHASVQARLEFAGLPEGARVVSCHGFDSRAQRSFGVPSVQAEPRTVTVRWPVTGPAGSSGLVERQVDDGEWAALETRPVDPDATLLVVDRRVEPGHVYRYRVSWSDQFGLYTSPEAVATPPRSAGFDFAGVRPNPSTGEFAASLELPEASEVRFEVLDVAGRVVASHARWLAAGAHVVPLTEHSALAPGLYVVLLRYRGLEFKSSVVVLR